MANQLKFEDFELRSVEIKSPDYTVEWFEHYEEEVLSYDEKVKRTKKIWQNTKLEPLLKRLKNRIQTKEENVELVKFEIREIGGDPDKIKFTFQYEAKAGTVNKTTTKMTNINVLYGDDSEEVMTLIMEIKLNLYDVLIKGEKFLKAKSVSMVENGEFSIGG